MINNLNYCINNSEKSLIKKVNQAYKLDNLDKLVLYKYGLYVNILAGINKGIKKTDIVSRYEELPIKEKSEINISAKDICKLLDIKPGKIIGEIFSDLETKIINKELVNDKDELINYIKNKYKK